MIATSVAKLKNLSQEAKFSRDKMAEKSRFCELSAKQRKKLMENAIPATTKKATNFCMTLFNSTYLKFSYILKKNVIAQHVEVSSTDKHHVTKTITKFSFKIFRMAC